MLLLGTMRIWWRKGRIKRIEFGCAIMLLDLGGEEGLCSEFVVSSSVVRVRFSGWCSLWWSGSPRAPGIGVNVVWERITPEQAARAYVQMIVDGDFETWDELNPPDPVWCHNGRCIMTLTEVSAQREQGPPAHRSECSPHLLQQEVRGRCAL